MLAAVRNSIDRRQRAEP